MGFWSRLFNSSQGVFRSEASVDLDILYNHDEASRLMVGVDLGRLERINRSRRAKRHEGFGTLTIDGNNNLWWAAARNERGCGVRDIRLAKEEMRSLDIGSTVVTAVMLDGTNLVFIVNIKAKPSGKRRPAVSPSAF
jgi:hypothetical protein